MSIIRYKVITISLLLPAADRRRAGTVPSAARWCSHPGPGQIQLKAGGSGRFSEAELWQVQHWLDMLKPLGLWSRNADLSGSGGLIPDLAMIYFISMGQSRQCVGCMRSAG